ncbi:PstS family phosphate ABC transporter substrate-binding protein [Amycolatopsis nigrescens]|uniref:PstS family phosphate ABC transporter substrate-binding protein n=1 Tax=Amycolatopsis nigrescens TaxID=381445 RepID=UPI000363F46F|nr:substrate-binding domain-containing protein [Amycolatopsis nigrescens]
MGNFPWEIVIAVVGAVVPLLAFVYEFAVVGRKRLGYRVQMDTTAAGVVNQEYAGALRQLQEQNGRSADDEPTQELFDPSFVLLRIENNGATNIDTSDYAVLPEDKVGIQVKFPGRRVAGMVVTELSDEHLGRSFEEGSGLGVRNAEDSDPPVGMVLLPKAPMNRGQHYKVLTVLQRDPHLPGDRTEFEEPQVVGGIKGGAGRGGIQETKSHTGISRRTIALVGFLVVVVLTQLTVSLTSNRTAPLDCAGGQLALTGSTAFAPVLKDAAASYQKTCPDAHFTLDAQGSGTGLERLNQEGRKLESGSPNILAFSDGAKPDGYPQLLPRPIAFSLFTLLVNKDTGVGDLTLDQIKQLYDGQITNWAQLRGNDLPVRLVSRPPDSGTRKTFQQQLLDGKREPGSNSDDCRTVDPGAEPGVVRCERVSTNDVLDTVARTPGAIGYSEVGAATGREDLVLVRIGGHQADLEGADAGAYPFWETEFAYTYGETKADSLAASFLRYLTNEVGKDIVRSYGNRSCSELENPVLCRPM